jgi:hypothetical protein
MIVRIDVQRHPHSAPHWQLRRCQVELNHLMEDVGDPKWFRAIRFETLQATVRYAKKATFTRLEQLRYAEMPDQIDWRIYEEGHGFPCPVCQQPLYRKAKLARYGHTLDLQDWGCPRCKKPVTTNTDGLPQRVISLGGWTPEQSTPPPPRIVIDAKPYRATVSEPEIVARRE